MGDWATAKAAEEYRYMEEGGGGRWKLGRDGTK